MFQVSFTRGMLLSIIVGCVFFTGLGSARLWDRDEPRNSRASHEMLERGDWVVPTFNGELRDHKPVLLYWGQMLAYQVFGESEFTARLPSALASILAVLATAILASRISGHKYGISNEGFWAAGALATSLLFVMATRAATPDALLIASGTLGIAALVLSTLKPVGPYSSGAVQAARWPAGMFGYAMFGVAILAKGPVGIVLPLAVVHIWWCFSYEMNRTQSPSTSTGIVGLSTDFIKFLWRALNPVSSLRALWQLKVIPGVLVALAISAPWYYQVGVETNGAFLKGFFLDHNVGRAVSSMEGHSGNILFYPVAFLVGTFPWSLWLIPVLLWVKSIVLPARTAGESTNTAHSSPVTTQLLTLAAVWIAVYLGAFTIASTKLPSYISPCYPGAALAVGCYLRHMEMNWYAPSRWLRYVAYAVTCSVGAAICGVLVFLSREQSMPTLATAGIGGAVIAGLGIFAFASEAFARVRPLKSSTMPLAWLVAAGCFNVIIFGWGTASVDQYRGDLAILRSAAESSPEDTQWISIGGMEPSWVYYLDSTIAEVRRHARHPEAWEQVEEQLNQSGQSNVIVVGDEAIQKINSVENPLSRYNLEELQRSDRFLREGQIAIYRVTRPTEQVSRVARLDVNTSETGQTVKTQPDETAALPELEPKATIRISGPVRGDATNSSIDRTASRPQLGPQGPYNPLRPDENKPLNR